MIDQLFMHEALKEAKRAFDENEVPVGCVIVLNDRIISRGHNQTEQLKDATAHAEMIALTSAANYLGNWRLEKATVYTTIEPCIMCASALVLSRVKRVVYGAADAKFGGAGSIVNLLDDKRLNHRVAILPGILQNEAEQMMKEFFRKKRKKGTVPD